MRNPKKALIVTWEYVPDRDFREKLRQAFAIILRGDNDESSIPDFDEIDLVEQDEGAAKG